MTRQEETRLKGQLRSLEDAKKQLERYFLDTRKELMNDIHNIKLELKGSNNVVQLAIKNETE